jgi:hypothetical protein
LPTKLVVTQRYTASPAKIYSLFCDPDFLTDRLAASGGIDPELVSQEVTERGLSFVTRQGVPASALPSIVSSFFSGNPTTQRAESWRSTTDGYAADLAVTILGAPASLKGTITLAPDGTGSTVSVDAAAAVPVPIFGGKIEKVIVEQITELLRFEETFTQQRLTAR